MVVLWVVARVDMSNTEYFEPFQLTFVTELELFAKRLDTFQKVMIVFCRHYGPRKMRLQEVELLLLSDRLE